FVRRTMRFAEHRSILEVYVRNVLAQFFVGKWKRLLGTLIQVAGIERDLELRVVYGSEDSTQASDVAREVEVLGFKTEDEAACGRLAQQIFHRSRKIGKYLVIGLARRKERQ